MEGVSEQQIGLELIEMGHTSSMKFQLSGEKSSKICKRRHPAQVMSFASSYAKDMESAEVQYEQKSSASKWDKLRKYKKRQSDVGKARDSYIESEARSGEEIDDKAPLEECRLSSLKSKVAKLQEKNFRLCREMKRRSELCSNLRDGNRILMDKLMKICEPEVIQYLESINPDIRDADKLS